MANAFEVLKECMIFYVVIKYGRTQRLYISECSHFVGVTDAVMLY